MTQIIQAVGDAEVAGPDYEMESLLAEVKAEAEAMEIGDIAKTEQEQTLYRYLRRRSQLTSEIEHIQAQTTALIRAMEARLKGLDYVYFKLAEETVRELLKGKSAKSIKTPFGTAGFRKVQSRIDVSDEDKLLKAAESDINLIGLIVEKREVSRSAVADHFKSTGEIPPGCELLPEQNKFYVK